MGALLAFIMKFVSSGVVGRVLQTIEKRTSEETERERIRSAREQNESNNRRDVVVAAMQHKMFWVPWSIAAIPTALWYGWGMMDTALNGALPDVASIPPGLEPWAQTVWNNIFYTGAGVAAAGTVGSAIAQVIRRR